MKYTIFTLAFIMMLLSNLSAQKRIMVQAVDVIEGKKKFSLFPKNSGSTEALRVVPPYCINFFANNKKFIVIESNWIYIYFIINRSKMKLGMRSFSFMKQIQNT